MGKTRLEHDLEIEEQVKLMPSLLRKTKKHIEVPHPTPQPTSVAAPAPLKSKFNEGKFNVRLGQRIKRFTGKLIRFNCRFTWEQLEMIKGLSKTIGVSKAEVLRIAVVDLYGKLKAIPFR